MKMLWNVIAAFVVINLLAAAGYVGLMYVNGQISEDRIDKAVDIFSLTFEEEADQEADVQEATEKSQKLKQQQAYLKKTAEGPVPMSERLAEEVQADESALARLQFFNDQNKALREEMARFKEDHAQRVAKLEKEREAFEAWVKQRAEQTKDENFLQVVSLYEKQSPKQTKQAFQTLMQNGETEQVVEYLAAMSSRKAGAVLGQFKSPAEVAQAVGLLEKLRTRGEYTMDPQASPLQDQS